MDYPGAVFGGHDMSDALRDKIRLFDPELPLERVIEESAQR